MGEVHHVEHATRANRRITRRAVVGVATVVLVLSLVDGSSVVAAGAPTCSLAEESVGRIPIVLVTSASQAVTSEALGEMLGELDERALDAVKLDVSSDEVHAGDGWKQPTRPTGVGPRDHYPDANEAADFIRSELSTRRREGRSRLADPFPPSSAWQGPVAVVALDGSDARAAVERLRGDLGDPAQPVRFIDARQELRTAWTEANPPAEATALTLGITDDPLIVDLRDRVPGTVVAAERVVVETAGAPDVVVECRTPALALPLQLDGLDRERDYSVEVTLAGSAPLDLTIRADEPSTSVAPSSSPPKDGGNTDTSPSGRDRSSRLDVPVGLLIGLVVGGVVGSAGTLVLLRRRGSAQRPGHGDVRSGPPGSRSGPWTLAAGMPGAATNGDAVGAATSPLAPHDRPRPAAPGWTGTVPEGKEIRLEDVGLTRIRPEELGRGRSWSVVTDRYLAIAGWTEKVEGKGEDAPPAFRMHTSGAGLVATFDGTGGAGAGVARQLGDGRQLTGAYVASRLSSEVLQTWFTRAVDRGEPITPSAVERFRNVLTNVLRDEAGYAPEVAGNGLKGSLKRVLPTTMAAIAFRLEDDAVVAHVLWAGDSRAYAMGPMHGLQVLSVDDTRETDAMALIRNDMPMDNLISADQDFRINHRSYRMSTPRLLLTATDGCFGYVQTPAHFEFLVLETLLNAPSASAWVASLVEEFDAVAGDDVSFALAGGGFTSFGHLQDAFGPRHDYLRAEHWERFAALAGDRDAFEAMRESSWEVYRHDYHGLLEPAVVR